MWLQHWQYFIWIKNGDSDLATIGQSWFEVGPGVSGELYVNDVFVHRAGGIRRLDSAAIWCSHFSINVQYAPEVVTGGMLHKITDAHVVGGYAIYLYIRWDSIEHYDAALGGWYIQPFQHWMA